MLAYLIIGFTGGLLSGLLGVGGGVIFVPLLTYLTKIDFKTNTGISSLAVVFVATASSLTYIFNDFNKGFNLVFAILVIVTGGIIGGYLGSKLTPKINNKILISFQALGETSANSHSFSIVLKRTISGGASTLIQGDIQSGTTRRPVFTQTLQAYDVGDQDTTLEIAHCSNYLDSPNTTSAVTYQLQIKNHEGGTGTYYYNRTVRDDNANHSERGLSWVTAMEVASGVL